MSGSHISKVTRHKIICDLNARLMGARSTVLKLVTLDTHANAPLVYYRLRSAFGLCKEEIIIFRKTVFILYK